jgi:CHAT domain-containing protein
VENGQAGFPATSTCPDAELLALYCEGATNLSERRQVEAHLAECRTCREVVVETRLALAATGAGRRSWQPWILGAAFAAALLAGVWMSVRLFEPRGGAPGNPQQALAQLALALDAERQRPVPGRLSIGAAYAPLMPPQRGDAPEGSPDLRIAAGQVERLALAENNPDIQAALGLAYLTTGRHDRAVEALEAAVRDAPGRAHAQSDLAAAYIARATSRGRGDDWSRALAAAERAIAADPSALPAWFNRAVALEALHLRERAIEGWADYLERDASSGWAAEARQRLEALRRRAAGAAAPAPDTQAVRERIEDTQLPAWGAALLDGDLAAANRHLEDATREARALADAGGDAMPRDQVILIAATRDPALLRVLAEGHVAFGRARAAYLAERLDEAARLMREAADRFARAASPYAAWAPAYEAVAVRASGSPERALQILAAVPADQSPATYHHLRGRLAWLRGAAHASLGRYDRARAEHAAAVAVFARTAEVENVSANRTHLAEAEWALGNDAAAWRSQMDALAQLDRLKPVTRRHVILFTGAYFCLASQLPEAALHFQTELVSSVSNAADHAAVTDALMQRAEIFAVLGDIPRARADLDAAEAALSGVPDAGLRARSLAELRRVQAQVLLPIDAGAAASAASSALEYFQHSAAWARLAEVFAARARALEALGDRPRALADFQHAADAFERAWQRLEDPVDRLHALGDQRATYRAWAALALRQGDPPAALGIWERGRAHALPATARNRGDSAAAAARQLAGDAAAVYYLLLPDRLVAWTLTRESVSFIEQPGNARALAHAVNTLVRAIEAHGDADDVASALTAPLRAALEPVRAAAALKRVVVVVPDGELWRVPFAAAMLVEAPDAFTGRAIVVSSSLDAFLQSSTRLHGVAGNAVLAVGDGHDPAMTALPVLDGANREALEVSRLYRRAETLTGPEATIANVRTRHQVVLHFAGHTVVNRTTPLLSHLLLAPAGAGDGGAYFGADILRGELPRTRVVVLASCESGAGRARDGDGPVSIAALFLAAGAGSVIASPWPVDDGSRELLVDLHRGIAAGHDPASALMAAQEALLADGGRTRPVREWGGFSAFGGAAGGAAF